MRVSHHANRITVREVTLSDGSTVFDVLVDDNAIYNATGFTDAYDCRDALRRVLETHETIRPTKIRPKDPLRARLNMLSYHFAYDSPEARTCSEAIENLAP